jgi:hypothetical protein
MYAVDATDKQPVLLNVSTSQRLDEALTSTGRSVGVREVHAARRANRHIAGQEHPCRKGTAALKSPTVRERDRRYRHYDFQDEGLASRGIAGCPR